MKIGRYNDMSVRLLNYTRKPAALVKRALSLTTGKSPKNRDFLRGVWDMGHESVFEHVVFSFLITGLSRNAIMQLTRHRVCSFTISSQHYRLQENSSLHFSTDMIREHGTEIRKHVFKSLALYKRLLKKFTREEARQVLPGAVCSDLVWTVNARELALFLRLRRCNRNIMEIKLLARKVMAAASEKFPLIAYMGRIDCEKGRCLQGKWSCKRRRMT